MARKRVEQGEKKRRVVRRGRIGGTGREKEKEREREREGEGGRGREGEGDSGSTLVGGRSV